MKSQLICNSRSLKKKKERLLKQAYQLPRTETGCLGAFVCLGFIIIIITIIIIIYPLISALGRKMQKWKELERRGRLSLRSLLVLIFKKIFVKVHHSFMRKELQKQAAKMFLISIYKCP